MSFCGNGNAKTDKSNKDNDLNGHANGNGSNDSLDVERGPNGNARKRPDMFRFRDAATAALGDKRRQDLKDSLLKGVDREGLEKFRKSDDEVSLQSLHWRNTLV